MPYSPIMNVMLKAVRKVARGLIRDFGEVQHLQVSQKGPGNFVSNADIRTEKNLVAELLAAKPDYSVLAEESGASGKKDFTFRWVIDPIDGTTNFLHSIPYFCISLALEKTIAKGKTEIVAAVIDAPILGDTYWAEKGAGAWLERGDEQMRLRVSARKSLQDALVMVGGINMGGAEQDARISAAINRTSGIRDMGSSALSLAYLAAGRSDVFFQNGEQPWDIAAGILLIKEAGGQVTDFSGSDTMMTSGEVLASNMLLHKEAMALFCKK